MERIKRALELARQERGTLLDAAPKAMPNLAVAEPVARLAEPEAETRRSVAISQGALRRARLLLPGLGGEAAHGFRVLRTQVLQKMRERNWNTLAIVSAAPDEGKTFTAINLAIATAATADAKAVLVDLDLRFPRVYRRLDVVPEVTVEDCLRGEATLADALLDVEDFPGLTLLPARGPVEHSSELISSPHARFVFSQLQKMGPSQIVIYDLPPILAAADALVFIPQVECVLVVVNDGQTRRDELMQCLDLLRDVPVLGVVLNGSRGERSARYAY